LIRQVRSPEQPLALRLQVPLVAQGEILFALLSLFIPRLRRYSFRSGGSAFCVSTSKYHHTRNGIRIRGRMKRRIFKNTKMPVAISNPNRTPFMAGIIRRVCWRSKTAEAVADDV
jgi:hypothetical protein